MGSGAVGGYFGAVLHRGGHQVEFVARGEQLETIRQHGLRIESVTSGDFTIRPEVAERPDGSSSADLVMFCVKGYDNPEAIATMAPAVGPDTAVLTLQNGLGSGDELAAAFGHDSVLLGVTYIDAVRKEPGVVAELGGHCNIIFGEESGESTPRAVAVRDAMSGSGIEISLSSDVRVELWNKLIFICALSGMTCITRARIGQVLDTPETLDLTWKVMWEAEAVGRAQGVELDEGIVDTNMRVLEGLGESAVSSMYMDLERGNWLEVGVLNGAIDRLGKEAHVPTPVNSFITACLTVAHNRAAAQRDSADKGG